MKMLTCLAAGTLLCSGGVAHAQCDDFLGYPVTPIAAAPDGSVEDSWAAALAPVVEGRRIVMLGEPSHGDGASIRARAQIVKVLHERFGYDVLAFEGDFFGLNGYVDEGHAAPSEVARDNLYWFWSRSPAAAALWETVDASQDSANPIEIAGFDIRMGGTAVRSGLADTLTQIGAKAGIAPPPALAPTLTALIEKDREPAIEQEDAAALDRFLTQVLQSTELPARDLALAASVASWLDYAVEGANRDIGMAQNLRWLADRRFAGRKIIVWAHSNHALRDESVWEAAGGGLYRHLGNLFADGREDEVAVIGTIASSGSIDTGFIPALSWQPVDYDREEPLVDRAPDSAEAILQARCTAPALLALDRNREDPPAFMSYAIDANYGLEADYARAFDALLFVGESYGLDDDPPAARGE